jgi:AraC family transcriptional activator of pobA
MAKKRASIPVNNFGGEFDEGIVIEKLSFNNLPDLSQWSKPERHDRHSFFLLEKGNVRMEIDFHTYEINAPALIYMHPDQVHCMLGFEDVTVISWAIDNESLNADYLQLLEDITPARPIALIPEKFSLIAEAAALCIRLAEQKTEKFHQALLKDSCNTLVALVISQYMRPSSAAYTRYDVVNKAFRKMLDRNYATLKSPAAYAEKLDISTPYLNECVKNATGNPVSYHIRQRIILEAKRLLRHSGKSVKEIAAGLGYTDYPYFSRIFTKAAGISALDFRNKNLE